MTKEKVRDILIGTTVKCKIKTDGIYESYLIGDTHEIEIVNISWHIGGSGLRIFLDPNWNVVIKSGDPDPEWQHHHTEIHVDVIMDFVKQVRNNKINELLDD